MAKFQFFSGFKTHSGRPPGFMTFEEQAKIARKRGAKALVKINRLKRINDHAK
jgi:hypothetical protein